MTKLLIQLPFSFINAQLRENIFYFFQFCNLLRPTWFFFEYCKYVWPWKGNYSDCLTMAILVTVLDMYSWHIMSCNNSQWQYFQVSLIPFKKLKTIQICAMVSHFSCRIPSKNVCRWRPCHIFSNSASFKTFEKSPTPSSIYCAYSTYLIF